MAELKAGVGYSAITPPTGVALAHGAVYQPVISRGRRGNLDGAALVLEYGSERFALLQLDLFAVSAQTTNTIRVAVSRLTQIAAENIIIACARNNSSPATILKCGGGRPDAAYMEILPPLLASAVLQGIENLETTEVFAGRSNLVGATRSVPNSDGLTDSEMQTLEFISQESADAILLFCFACPPDSFEAEDAEISPDFLTRARRLLESEFEDALFLQGSCGDVESVYARQNEMPRVGQMIAGAAFIAVGQAVRQENPYPVRCVSRTIPLPLNPPTRAELENRRDDNRALLAERDANTDEGRRARFWAESCESLLMQLTGESDPWLEMLRDAQAEIAAQTSREPRLGEIAQFMDLPPDAVSRLLRLQQEHAAEGIAPPKALDCEIQILQIGDAVLLAHPLELCAEFGLEIKRRSPFPHTFLISCANGYLGVLPNEAAFARRDYAAEMLPYALDQFPFAPNAGRVFTEACLSILQEIK